MLERERKNKTMSTLLNNNFTNIELTSVPNRGWVEEEKGVGKGQEGEGKVGKRKRARKRRRENEKVAVRIPRAALGYKASHHAVSLGCRAPHHAVPGLNDHLSIWKWCC